MLQYDMTTKRFKTGRRNIKSTQIQVKTALKKIVCILSIFKYQDTQFSNQKLPIFQWSLKKKAVVWSLCPELWTLMIIWTQFKKKNIKSWVEQI